MSFNASAETAKIFLNGYPEHGPEDGFLGITFQSGAATVGSLSGDGAVRLGVHKLNTGGLDDDSTFSGTIVDEEGKGSLAKTGNGRLLRRAGRPSIKGSSIYRCEAAPEQALDLSW